MEASNRNSVLCLGDTKQAALYFDRVLPISFILTDLMLIVKEMITIKGCTYQELATLSQEERMQLAKQVFRKNSRHD